MEGPEGRAIEVTGAELAEVLARASSSQSSERWAAAIELGDLGGHAAARQLRGMSSDDPDETVRRAAKCVLERLPADEDSERHPKPQGWSHGRPSPDAHELTRAVISVLERAPEPLKARDVAALLRSERGWDVARGDVNACLYSSLVPLGHVRVDRETYRWSWCEAPETEPLG